MSTAALIAAKQNKYMRKFSEAGATSREAAKTLEAIGCSKSLIFNRLVAKGVIVECPDGTYYMNVSASEDFLERRRRLMLVALALAVLGVVLFYLFAK